MTSKILREYAEKVNQSALMETEMADALGYLVVVGEDAEIKLLHDLLTRRSQEEVENINYDSYFTKHLEEGQYLAKGTFGSDFTNDITQAKMFPTARKAKNAAKRWKAEMDKLSAAQEDTGIYPLVVKKAFIMLDDV